MLELAKVLGIRFFYYHSPLTLISTFKTEWNMHISQPSDEAPTNNPRDSLARARKYLALVEKLLWISHSVGDNMMAEGEVVQGSRAFTEVQSLSQLFEEESKLGVIV